MQHYCDMHIQVCTMVYSFLALGVQSLNVLQWPNNRKISYEPGI